VREVTILCESATCNAGLSAADREARLIPPRVTDTLRGDAERQARSIVSQQLVYTPHVRVSGVHRGLTRFACTVCQHERVYGSLAWAWEDGPYS
jgi:hypothetical protein